MRQRLRERTVRRGPAVKAAPSPLAGKLFSEDGRPLTSAQAVNHGRRYRYYVSRDARQEDGTTVRRGWRLPAGEIERAVAAAARTLLDDQGARASTLAQAGIDLSAIPPILEAAHQCGQGPSLQLLEQTLERADLRREGLTVTLKLAALIPAGSGHEHNPQLSISRCFPMIMQHRGVGLKLILPATRAAAPAAADPALLKALARSRQWFEELSSGRASSMTALAQKAGVSRRYVARLLPLAFLAPAIVEAIATGQARLTLTAEQLTRHLALPLDWNE